MHFALCWKLFWYVSDILLWPEPWNVKHDQKELGICSKWMNECGKHCQNWDRTILSMGSRYIGQCGFTWQSVLWEVSVSVIEYVGWLCSVNDAWHINLDVGIIGSLIPCLAKQKWTPREQVKWRIKRRCNIFMEYSLSETGCQQS